jgi:hypothetical protein
MFKKTKFAGWFFALALCLLGVANTANAAAFTVQPADKFGPVSVLIKGRIDVGDFDKFKNFLLQPGHLKAYANYVWLDSIGGDLNEAMKFASLFEASSASVVVGPDGKCYSACFMMFAAAADRWLYTFGELGVHRVSVNSPNADRAQRREIERQVSEDLRRYLGVQGIPATLIDQMMETPAFDMTIIDTKMLKRMGWLRGLASRPSFLAAVEKVCGAQPDIETVNTAKPGAWTACKIDYQIKSTKGFAAAELALLDAGQPSLLFAPGKLLEARRAVGELQ